MSPPVIAGPPVVENGVATIAGKVDLEIRGSQVGTALIDFTCALGADGAPNVCQGTYLFEGTIRGESGTYSATLTDWTAGGDEAFTSAKFKLISGSGTGGLSNLVVAEGSVLRDEVTPVGVYFGTARFEAEAGDLSGYTISELFHLASAENITTDELLAELAR